MRALISFLTDFGTEDEYCGIMKAVIKSINPAADFIDISNSIPPCDVKRAAFVIGHSHKFFPRKSIHVIVVDPGVGTKRAIICVRAHDQIFIAPDNGVLSIVLKKAPKARIYKVTNKKIMLNRISNTFHGRDIFAPVAAHISNGVAIDKVGRKTSTFKKINIPQASISKNRLLGEILYSDRFGNLITNIDSKIFERIKGSCKIKIGSITINGPLNSYQDSRNNHPFAIFGSKGLLEVSVKKGSAAALFKKSKRITVNIPKGIIC